jgi:hypothetical protein
MARIATHSLRRMRSAAALALLTLGLAIATTTTREKGWHVGEGWFICVANACVQVGQHRSRLMDFDPIPPGPYTKAAWNPDYAFAWRPFHSRSHRINPGPTPTINWQLLVIPLWPFAAVSLAFLAYTHGRLAMLRDLRSRTCPHCGYDLTHTSTNADQRICPECGGSSPALHHA